MQEDVNTLSYGHINSRLQHTVDDNKHRLSYGHRNRTQTIQQMTTHTYRYIMSVWTLFNPQTTFHNISAVHCIANSVYSSEVSACPASCMDRSPSCEGLPYSEGCTCDAGYFRSGHECVPASTVNS
jgi:hypothetical protein